MLVPERDRPRVLEHIKTDLATGDPEEFTGQLLVPTLHADGTERVAELTPVQITIGGQAIFTGFLRDLTEIERSHAEVAEQTERLNCVIASAIPGVLITDAQGTVSEVVQSSGACSAWTRRPSRSTAVPVTSPVRPGTGNRLPGCSGSDRSRSACPVATAQGARPGSPPATERAHAQLGAGLLGDRRRDRQGLGPAIAPGVGDRRVALDPARSRSDLVAEAVRLAAPAAAKQGITIEVAAGTGRW